MLVTRRRLLGLILALVASLALTPRGAEAAPSPAPSTSAPAGSQARLGSPDNALGAGWRSSSDVLITGIGDSDGFHLYVAREKDAFAWSTLATLTASALDMGPWTGDVCVTGSGHYAVAVYAPAAATNRPDLLESGALAAVVDTTTGKARLVASGVQLAYFNPACGPGDRVLLTRAIGSDMQQTDLLTVDAATARVTSTRRINAQLTTPVPAPDGDYGIAHGALVRIAQSGALTTVAHPDGQPFTLSATAHNGIDIASVNTAGAIVQRFTGNATLTDLATGPRDKLQLFALTGGRDALVGQVHSSANKVPALTTVAADSQVAAVSGQGHLLAMHLVSAQAAQAVKSPLARPDRHQAGSMQVTVRATRSGQTNTAIVTTEKAPRLDGLPSAAKTSGPNLAPNDGTDPLANPLCAVGRNDPHIQPLQPSPDMVEWAVDQAVHGRLTVSRPDDYLATWLPSYSPQGMFPLHSLVTGGTVPAQIMLGILAQESNLDEASWHAVPGDTGNPLIADYYGNERSDAPLDSIYSNPPGESDGRIADCGYGIGQVTDGMATSDGTTVYSRNQQIAIAVDYAANIAAALNILISKWNQLRTDPGGPTYVNGGSPQYIENWFLAVWAYNTGFHASTDASDNYGAWGVGWGNNPDNPAYPSNREPFLRFDYGDASHPGDWPYEERVMGWAETPERIGGWGDAYSQPVFGDSGFLNLPPAHTFCNLTQDTCDPTIKPPLNSCQYTDSYCWWHGTSANWASNCAQSACSTEWLEYGASAPEPGVQRSYDLDCESSSDPTDPNHDTAHPTLVVGDLNDPTEYAERCGQLNDGGKFTLRLGSVGGGNGSPGNSGVAPQADYAQIDLHQLGAGFDGHIWFTHVYPPDYQDESPPENSNHKVVGTWTPNLDLTLGQSRNYDILVHLPSHGGNYNKAEYDVFTSGLTDTPTNAPGMQGPCVINQDDSDGNDIWEYIGNYNLSLGARVELSNVGTIFDDGTTDIAYDAVAFVPLLSGHSSICGHSH